MREYPTVSKINLDSVAPSCNMELDRKHIEPLYAVFDETLRICRMVENI